MRISDWSSDVCSSDLVALQASGHRFDPDRLHQFCVEQTVRGTVCSKTPEAAMPRRVAHRENGLLFCLSRRRRHPSPRSEEHTSELQSLMRISYAVFCLKKKKSNSTPAYHIKSTNHYKSIEHT